MRAYVGLFADEAHSDMSVSYTGPTTIFEMWIWWLPSVNGIQMVEYNIVYPSNVAPGAVTVTPLRDIGMGGCELPAGSCAFSAGNCRSDWVWSHHQTCILLDDVPSVIEITGEGYFLDVANCLPGYPIEDVTVVNHLYLNQPGELATEQASWGAIKSLYR